MNSQEKYFFLQPSFKAERNKYILAVLSVVSDLSDVPRLLISFPFRLLPSVGLKDLSHVLHIAYLLKTGVQSNQGLIHYPRAKARFSV